MPPLAIIDLDSDDDTPSSPQNTVTNIPASSKENPIDLTFDDSESEQLPSDNIPQIPNTNSSTPRVTNSTQRPTAPQPRKSVPLPAKDQEDEDSDEDFYKGLHQIHKPQATRVKRSLNRPDAGIAIPPFPVPTRKRAKRASDGSGGAGALEEDVGITSMKIPAHVRRLSRVMNSHETSGDTTKKSGLRAPPLTSARKAKENKANDDASNSRLVQNMLKRIRDAPTEALVPPAPKSSRTLTAEEEPTTTRAHREKGPQKEPTPQPSSGKETTEPSEAEDPPPVTADFSANVTRFFSPSTESAVEVDIEGGRADSMDYELDTAAGPYDPTAASRGAGSSRDTAMHNLYDIPQAGWRSQAAPSAPSSSSKPTNQDSATGSDHASSLAIPNSSNKRRLNTPLPQFGPLQFGDPAAIADAPRGTDNRKRKRKAAVDSDEEDVFLPRVGGKKARARRDVPQDDTELYALLDGIQATLAPKSKQIENSDDLMVNEIDNETTAASQLDIEQDIQPPSENGNPSEGVADEVVQDNEIRIDEDEANNDADIEMTPVEADVAVTAGDNRTESEMDEIDELEDDDLDERPDIQLDTGLILGPHSQINFERPGFLELIRDSQPSLAKGTGPGYLYTPSPVPIAPPLPTEPTILGNASPQPTPNLPHSDGNAEVEDILVHRLSPDLLDRSPNEIGQKPSIEEIEETQEDGVKGGLDEENDEGDETIMAIDTGDDGPSVVQQAPATPVEPILASPNLNNSTLGSPLDTISLPFPAVNHVEPCELRRQKLLADNKEILKHIPRFQGGSHRPSLTPLHAPWEILKPYFKRRLESEGKNLNNSPSAQRQEQRQESSVEL